MTKRGFAEVTGHHSEKQRLKWKGEAHSMYDAEGMEHDDPKAKKNGCMVSINETHANVDSTGKSVEASAIGLFSPQKEFLNIDTELNNEDYKCADKSRVAERSTITSEARKYLVINGPLPNLPERNQAPLSQVDQGCTSSDFLSEAARSATMNNHLPSDILPVEKDGLSENFYSVSVGSSREDLRSHNDFNGTILKQHSLATKLRINNLPDYTEYVSEGNLFVEPSRAGCHPDSNESSAETETTGDVLSVKNPINAEKNSQSYSTKGLSNVAEKDMVGMTIHHTSCSAEVFKHRLIDSMPLLTDCCNDKNSKTKSQKMIQATAAKKVNPAIHKENISACTLSSAISIEINQKVLSGNFKSELSLPPSPITGVIDSFVDKPNRKNNNLNSLNVEETAFSFQLPNRIFHREIPNNDPLNAVPIGIHGDRVTPEKESIASFSCCPTSEDDSISKFRGNEVQKSFPMLSEKSLTSSNRRKLLVLDINGLLCDIVNDYTYKGEKKIGGKPIFKRPFCDEFLKFCFDNFDIGIWSSRRKYNVVTALDYLMGEFKNKLLFCWDQSKCTFTGVRTLENQYKPLVLKELKKLWDKEESDLPWEKGEFSPSNTLLLDDSPYKALLNPSHTAIFPHPYHCTDEEDKSLGPGGDIRVYLEHLLVAEDVQLYVEEHPFGQPPITTADQHWNFYCNIIKRHATS